MLPILLLCSAAVRLSHSSPFVSLRLVLRRDTCFLCLPQPSDYTELVRAVPGLFPYLSSVDPGVLGLRGQCRCDNDDVMTAEFEHHTELLWQQDVRHA